MLLEGKNYDYAKQQKTKLISEVYSTSERIIIMNTGGFSDNDYILIDPKTEIAEIVQIISVIDDTTLEVTSLRFTHPSNIFVYRVPYNKMRFYYSTNDTDFNLISTVDVQYDQDSTNYEYSSGLLSYYYKRTFYNSHTDTESAIDASTSWQIEDETLTAEELRIIMQFDENDYPNPSDMKMLIEIAALKLHADVLSGDTKKLKYALILLSKFQVWRALAAKALSKGYIQINAEGRNITKAYNELLRDSETAMQEYMEFLINNFREETSYSRPLYKSGAITSEALQNIRDTMYGVNNILNYESNRSYRSRRP
jgi:hypothetical protein